MYIYRQKVDLLELLLCLDGESLPDVGDDVVAPLHGEAQLRVPGPGPDEAHNLRVGHQRDQGVPHTHLGPHHNVIIAEVSIDLRLTSMSPCFRPPRLAGVLRPWIWH